MKIESAPYVRYPAYGAEFPTAWVDGRAWVAIEPVCDGLGIDAAQQARRLRRHEECSGLPLKAARLGDEQFLLIQLPDLLWFMRTLRPKDERALLQLQRWRSGLWWALADQVMADRGRYASRTAVRDQVRESHRIAHPSVPLPPPPPKRSITPATIARMRELKDAGYSLRQISGTVGYSSPTISQCLSGKYPCVKADAPTPGT